MKRQIAIISLTVVCLSFLCTLLLLMIVQPWPITAGPRAPIKTEIRAFWLRISSAESVEYSWEQRLTHAGFGDVVEYHSYLTRTIRGKRSRYFVGVSSSLPEVLLLRADEQDHMWLVAPQFNRDKEREELTVIGSLDRRTGSFINQYGMVIPPQMPVDDQEQLDRPPGDASDTKPTPYPAWAKPTGGTLLVKSGDPVLTLQPTD